MSKSSAVSAEIDANPCEDIDWLTRYPEWNRACVLVGMFLAAMPLSYGLGALASPGSDFALAVGALGLLLALGLGYSLWTTYTKGVLFQGLLGGLLGALIRFLFSRRKKDLEAAKLSLAEALGNRDRAEAIGRKIRSKAAVFVWLGTLFGLVSGSIVALAGSEFGAWNTMALYTATGFAYGFALCRLGRAGLILLLD